MNTLRVSWGTSQHSEVTKLYQCVTVNSCCTEMYRKYYIISVLSMSCTVHFSSADCSRLIMESCLLFMYMTNCVDLQREDRRSGLLLCNGNVHRDHWENNGNVHREHWENNGNVHREHWKNNGNVHRERWENNSWIWIDLTSFSCTSMQNLCIF